MDYLENILVIVIILIYFLVLLLLCKIIKWLFIGCYNEILLRRILKNDENVYWLLIEMCDKKHISLEIDNVTTMKLQKHNVIKRYNRSNKNETEYSLTWWAYILVVRRLKKEKRKQKNR